MLYQIARLARKLMDLYANSAWQDSFLLQIINLAIVRTKTVNLVLLVDAKFATADIIFQTEYAHLVLNSDFQLALYALKMDKHALVVLADIICNQTIKLA